MASQENRDQCLHLVASSGRYTHINGEMHQRVPFGCYKIGQIATGEKLKLLTNDVTHDPRVHDHVWAKRLGLVSFAGYRLLSEKKTPIGVLALFSKHAISSEENSLLEGLANMASKVIQAIKAENALRESEERYKRLVEGSPDILYTFSDTRGSIYYSQRVNDILGYTPEYLRQYPMRWNSSIHTEDQPHVQQALEEFLQGKPFAIEYRIRNARGEWRWFYDRSIGRREEKGEILIEGLASDITERKQTEEALQLEKEKAQRYFDIAGVMLMVLNVDETVAQINERGCEILRLPSEYIVGENWFDTFLPDSCREQLRRGFRDFVSGKIPRQEDMRVSGNENPVVCSDGKERMILWHTSAIFAADGKSIVGILSSGEDITERKKAEEQLQHYVDELRGANAELSQYAYVVSHDLKAPLRAIHNYADFLREDLEDDLEDEQRTYLDHLQNAVVEANTLVNDILELSWIGRQETAVEVVNMDTFIDSVIKALNLARDVEIVMSPDWPVLETKPVLLRQIFQNLIVNGVKFNTAPRKRIELGWRLLEGGQYEFSVRDNGIGIEPAHQEEIFRVFKRLHTKEEFEGTGVGLAIVKKAVGYLGGTIKIDSIPGKGSIFSLCIPRTIHS